jgi:hypothetical protein
LLIACRKVLSADLPSTINNSFFDVIRTFLIKQ